MRVAEHAASGRAHQPKADDGVSVHRASASTSRPVERSTPVRNRSVARFHLQEEAGHGERTVDRVGRHGSMCVTGVEVFLCANQHICHCSINLGVLDTEYDPTNLSFRAYIWMTVDLVSLFWFMASQTHACSIDLHGRWENRHIVLPIIRSSHESRLLQVWVCQ